MSLKRYQQKRDFRRTSEPRGKPRARGSLYCVQKHAASHLHYDFRLQIGGVLKSWAVPKGPSLDPKVRRLAMHVEDHPVEYGSFEGTIPKGEYGGGTVMLWDRGTWSLDDEDPETAYRQGKLHFTLHGEKLRGEWVLVKRGGRGEAKDYGKEPWFLFKVRDDEALEGDEDGVLDREDLSVSTGRTMDEITAGKRGRKRATTKPAKTRSAKTKRPAKKERPRSKPSAKRMVSRPAARKSLLAELSGAKAGPLPRTFKPQLATLVKQAPQGDDWFHEIKFDGYRMICRVDHRDVTFQSRNGLDWTARVPHLVQAVRGLGLASAILDGEVVALAADGSSNFQDLQNAFSEKRVGQLVYYVFDVLYLDGIILTKVRLEDRKHLLAEIMAGEQTGPVRDAGYLVGQGPRFYEEICRRGLEGIICKRRDRPYRGDRSGEWLKVKCGHREEFVIGGFTAPEGGRVGFGALVLGFYDDQKRLQYCGRVGTGFSDKLLQGLTRRLESLEVPTSPFVNLQGKTGQARGVRWVKPQLVAQVAFSQWTRDGILRHPSFLGLREDKPAAEVRREQPAPLAAVGAEPVKTTKKRTGKAAASSQANGLPASVRMTHPDKVLFPEDGITKAQVAGYYAQVADWMLPHVINRPLTLVRCPGGIKGPCFYQKHADKGMPKELGTVLVKEKSGKIAYPVIRDLEGLLSLVHMNTLEIHTWGARTDNVERPDRLVFDLDPDPSVPWSRVVQSARQLREFFESLDLTAFLKTTGGKGLHLVLPIERRTDWDDAKRLCEAIASAVTAADPERYTTNMSKAARKGKIFIDYLRNARGATAVAPYSTRSRPGCPVAAPISWDELARVKSGAQFTLQNMPARLAKLRSDPWADMQAVKQSLSKSLWKKLGAS